MVSRTGRAQRTKSKQVVLAEGFLRKVVQKLTFIEPNFAEAPLVVRAVLSLFCAGTQAPLFRFGVSVDTLLLLVTVAILLVEATNRHFFFYINMQVVTFITASAPILDPVDTYQLLSLALIHIIVQRLRHCLHHID